VTTPAEVYIIIPPSARARANTHTNTHKCFLEKYNVIIYKYIQGYEFGDFA